jgi:octaprenyl-diphosphate synthase
MSSDVALVDKVAKYRCVTVVRLAACWLKFRLVGDAIIYLVAALVEILHTATLVHDDVVDGAEVRQVSSINALWKNKQHPDG